MGDELWETRKSKRSIFIVIGTFQSFVNSSAAFLHFAISSAQPLKRNNVRPNKHQKKVWLNMEFISDLSK